MLVAAACGGGSPTEGATGGPDEPSRTATTLPAGSPSSATVSPDPTGGGQATPEPGDEASPSGAPAPGASEEPSPSADATDDVTGGAAACSGSEANREFFEGIAKAVEWPVLCGVLPRGWFVSEGAYRLANGGKVVIGYKGPAGATLTLSEGAFCAAADGCVPDGENLGAAALGPLDGTLHESPDGFAVIAAAGENPSWLLEAEGLDRLTTESLAAALAEVGR
jgi:hypothetical protein